MKKTTLRQNVTNADRTWFVIDAAGQTIGNVSVLAANKLRGKDRVDYTPHVDGGDYVVVLNADKVVATGAKEEAKKYYRHSGHIGHLKVEFLDEVRAKNPTRILEQAVGGMLPKTRHRKDQLTRLKLVVGSENPHAAQNPETLTVTK